MDFQVGDRVYVIGPNNTGKYGVIVNIDDNPFQPIAVCHDEPFTGGHDCEGSTEDGYGWFYNPVELELIDRLNQPIVDIISIADLI